MVSRMPIPEGFSETGCIGVLTRIPGEDNKCERKNICVPAEVKVVVEGIVSNSETASEGPIAEYHGLIIPGESNQCPCSTSIQ